MKTVILNLTTIMEVSVWLHAPAVLSPGSIWWYRRLGGPQSHSGSCGGGEKISCLCRESNFNSSHFSKMFELHSIANQKTLLFIVSAVRISVPTSSGLIQQFFFVWYRST
jgi:hypothetical protein